MSITIRPHGQFREGRAATIEMGHVANMKLLDVLEKLDIDPQTIGIVKINDLTGQIKYSLNEEIPDDSSIDFLPYLAGG